MIIHVCPIVERILLQRKMVKRKALQKNQSVNVIYHNEENDEKKGDYYVNPYLSQLTNEL